MYDNWMYHSKQLASTRPDTILRVLYTFCTSFRTMKSFTFYTLVTLTTGLAYALPQGTTTLVETATVVPYAPSPYPASPTTNEFNYLNYKESSNDDKTSRTNVHNAFLDYAPVLQQAILSLDDTNDETFDRWFQDTLLREDGPGLDGRAYVRGVFSQVFQASDTSPAPAEVVTSMVCSNNDFKSNCIEDVKAYTASPSFHICPLGMEQTIKASDIKCADLGDTVSETMNSLTSTLIHEFMHQKAAGRDAPNSNGQ